MGRLFWGVVGSLLGTRDGLACNNDGSRPGVPTP